MRTLLRNKVTTPPFICLGKFVHKRTTLKKITIDSHGRKRGYFREIENGHKTHFKAI